VILETEDAMQGIYRWLNPAGEEVVKIAIPETCIFCETVEFTEKGAGLRRLTRTEDGEPVEFPVVHVWDDPTRSPKLVRTGKDWKTEDTHELLKLWEETRLVQFRDHMLRKYHSMQVVYLMPPTIDEAHIYLDDQEFHGWRIEMIAAFFGGFKPETLDVFEWKQKIITDVGVVPHLRLVTNDAE
jgi:hypothetical protein